LVREASQSARAASTSPGEMDSASASAPSSIAAHSRKGAPAPRARQAQLHEAATAAPARPLGPGARLVSVAAGSAARPGQQGLHGRVVLGVPQPCPGWRACSVSGTRPDWMALMAGKATLPSAPAAMIANDAGMDGTHASATICAVVAARPAAARPCSATRPRAWRHAVPRHRLRWRSVRAPWHMYNTASGLQRPRSNTAARRAVQATAVQPRPAAQVDMALPGSRPHAGFGLHALRYTCVRRASEGLCARPPGPHRATAAGLCRARRAGCAAAAC